jgi:CPA2 family monovalent cation:H+ antiporter-2
LSDDRRIAVLLFKKIKQPLVLGYLIAGFLTGNHFDFFPQLKTLKASSMGRNWCHHYHLFIGLEFSLSVNESGRCF